jgi:hypothetical protein
MGLERWIPFTTSIYMMTVILLVSRCLTAPSRRPAECLRQSEALS